SPLTRLRANRSAPYSLPVSPGTSAGLHRHQRVQFPPTVRCAISPSPGDPSTGGGLRVRISDQAADQICSDSRLARFRERGAFLVAFLPDASAYPSWEPSPTRCRATQRFPCVEVWHGNSGRFGTPPLS